MEDGLVLAAELEAASSVPDAFEAFLQRREERCRLVVDSSMAIGRVEQAQAPPAEQTAIVDHVLRKLTEAI